MEKLKISTIFYSIQGEATHTGEASIFIRLYGCNLDCSFCDDLLHTDRNSISEYTYKQILEEIKQFPSKNIIITGGEASIYNLNEFIDFLHKYGYYISIETNGFNFSNIKNADWITYSPKDWQNIDENHCSEFKFVVNSNTNIDPILNLDTNKPIYIQPENYIETPNMDNIARCIKLVQKYPQFKLSVQMHKFLGVL